MVLYNKSTIIKRIAKKQKKKIVNICTFSSLMTCSSHMSQRKYNLINRIIFIMLIYFYFMIS